MEPDPTNGLSDDELADLARLVDGTLPADRRAEVEARVAASPQLSSIVERQGVALDALRDPPTPAPRRGCARTSTGAAARPARGARSHEDRPRRRDRGGDRRWRCRPASWCSRARSRGGRASPTPPHSRRSRRRAPPHAASPGTPQLLRAEVGDVPFPELRREVRLEAGRRARRRPAGRAATTVFYEKGGRTDRLHDRLRRRARRAAGRAYGHRGGVEYRAFQPRRPAGRHLGARRSHLRALRDGAAPELLALADWRGKGAIPF